MSASKTIINIAVEGCGNPLVLFHGWGFDHSIWYPLVTKLSNRHRLYLVDLPGFGLTPMMDWIIFRTRLLKKLPQRFGLIGWSMGGILATRLALEEPKRITYLINVASSPRFIKEEGWPGVDRRIFKAFYHNLARHPKRTLAQFIKLQLKDQVHMPRVSPAMPALDTLRYGLEILMRWDLRQKLAALSMPVSYMFGRLDPIIPHRIVNVMKIHYPNFKYPLFNHAEHAPFLSNTDEFISELEDFLR